MKAFRRFVLFVIIKCLAFIPLMANYIQITNVQVEYNAADEYVLVQFDLSWENSFRIYTGDPVRDNWDAAWIFIKWLHNENINADIQWKHAYLSNHGHQISDGFTYELGQSYIHHQDEEKPVGVFIFRDSEGFGAANLESVQLRMNYSCNNLTHGENIDVKIFGLEMVYVPDGAFFIGDGQTPQTGRTDESAIRGQFHKILPDASTTTPFLIDNEGEIILGGSIPGNLGNHNALGSGDDFSVTQSRLLPAHFPKGHKAFYIMKHEISQQAYVDFLNTLSSVQAANRIMLTAEYDSDPVLQRRHLIRFTEGVYSTSAPYVAKNYMSWADLAAYLDWAGLRPMTELEYEKACRGPELPVPGEFAWGNTMINYPSGYSDAYMFNETPEFYFNPTQTEGVIGNAIHFDGKSGYFRATDIYQNIEEITVSFWYLHRSVDVTGLVYSGGQRNFILGNSGNHSVGDPGFRFITGWDNPGRIQWRVEDNDTRRFATASTDELYIDHWAFITGTFSKSSNQTKIYIDGEVFGQSHTTLADYSGAGTAFKIGRNTSGELIANNTKVDEVRISNIARSEAWIKAKYHSGVGDLVTIAAESSGSIYPYKREITIHHEYIDEDLTDFPVLVRLHAPEFDFSKTRSDGHDIRFYSAYGTSLQFERDRHDENLEKAEYWVRIPDLLSGENTVITIEYGDELATDASDPVNVWDDNYLSVWHMTDSGDGVTGLFRDSSRNQNHGRNYSFANSVSNLQPRTIGHIQDPLGPNRVGSFARNATSRTEAGATYWGVLDMTGNVFETIISVGSPEGRSFTGLHGDGSLCSQGYANVSNWPASDTAIGTGLRGGGFLTWILYDLSVSYRGASNSPANTRNEQRGGRGVRTAP